MYLILDLYFKDGANDAHRVANDDEDVPTIQKLQSVRPGGVFTPTVPAVLGVLLFTAQGT